MIDINKVYKQCDFCKNLMEHLDDDIAKAEVSKYGIMEKYTAIQGDIIRLRKELMVLSKLLNPWGGKR